MFAKEHPVILVTGRQFDYDRALDIIQNEEYLDDVDLDDIRRQFDIVRKIGEFDENVGVFNEKPQRNSWIPMLPDTKRAKVTPRKRMLR